jgi:hypothetical protein
MRKWENGFESETTVFSLDGQRGERIFAEIRGGFRRRDLYAVIWDICVIMGFGI